jgi:hypothetical protein
MDDLPFSQGKLAKSILKSHHVILEEQLGPTLYDFDKSRMDRLSLFGGWIVLYECLDDPSKNKVARS